MKKIPKNVKWSFDNGYYEGSNLHFLSELNIDAYVACQKENSENLYDKSKFTYDDIKDEYICPEKKSLIFNYESFDKTKNKMIKVYKGILCKTCTKQHFCTKSKGGIRSIKRYPYEYDRIQMIEKMKTKEAQ